MFDTSEAITIVFMVCGFVGYQLSVLFLYQYFKHKKEKSQFSIILVYYAIIYASAMFGMITVALAQAFLDDPILLERFWNIGILIINLGIISFIFGMLREPFKSIVNSRVTIILAILTPLSFLPLIVIELERLLFLPSYIIRILSAIYFIAVQVKFIKISYGRLKKRLKLMVISQMFLIISMYMVSMFNRYGVAFEISSLISLIIGLCATIIITFIAIYQFPLFIEFNWNQKIDRFIVFNRKNFQVYYYYEFNKDLTIKKSDSERFQEIKVLLSRSYQGIQSIVSQASEIKSNVFKIETGEKYILYDDSPEINEDIVFAIIIQKDMLDLNYFLKTLKSRFLDYYRYFFVMYEIIENEFDIEKSIFSGFDKIIKELIE